METAGNTVNEIVPRRPLASQLMVQAVQFSIEYGLP
jgi:hypothetical protein